MLRATLLLVFAALVLGSIAYACPDSATTRASYYGPGFNGRRTASGQVFKQYEYTAAHRTWRFGTQVRVTNLRNGRNVVVTITDRGPYVHGRGLDLSVSAAQALGATASGVVPVRLEPLCQVASLKARS
jgi:rare lipoprotein A